MRKFAFQETDREIFLGFLDQKRAEADRSARPAKHLGQSCVRSVRLRRCASKTIPPVNFSGGGGGLDYPKLILPWSEKTRKMLPYRGDTIFLKTFYPLLKTTLDQGV